MRYGDILKQFRNAKGLTRKELSNIIGMTAATIVYTERNIRIPSTRFLVLSYRALGFDMDKMVASLDKEFKMIDRKNRNEETEE